MVDPVRTDRPRADPGARAAGLRVRAVLARARPVGRARRGPRRLRARARGDARRRRVASGGAWGCVRADRRSGVPARPGRVRGRAGPVRAARRSPAGDRALDHDARRLPSPQARPRQLADRRPRRPDRVLLRRARDAGHRPARRRGLLAAPRGRSPHGGARRQGLLPLSPSRVRADRLGRAAGRARPPRPARAVAGVGPGAPRARAEPGRVRADPRGGVHGRALQRHGAADRRPRAARRGPTTPTPRTRGGSSRRGRTSGSTPRPSTRSARGSRRSDTRCRRRSSDGAFDDHPSHRRSHRGAVPRRAAPGRPRDLAAGRADQPSARPPRAARRGAVARARVRSPARARLRNARAVPGGSRAARQRDAPDPAGARGPGPAPARVRAGRGAVGRGDGADPRLPERDVRVLRGAVGGVGAAGELDCGPRTWSRTRSSCATPTCRRPTR